MAPFGSAPIMNKTACPAPPQILRLALEGEPWESVCGRVNEFRSVFAANTAFAAIVEPPLEVGRHGVRVGSAPQTMRLIRTANTAAPQQNRVSGGQGTGTEDRAQMC